MIHVESTDKIGPVQWCVVSERSTGRILQIHHHVGQPDERPLDPEALAASALSAGADYEPDEIQVIHPAKGQTIAEHQVPVVIDGEIELVDITDPERKPTG